MSMAWPIDSRAGTDALEKSFKHVSVQEERVREPAHSLLAELNVRGLSSVAKSSRGLQLKILFSVRTHNRHMPFHVIESERSTWQHLVSGFLQRHLSALVNRNPLGVILRLLFNSLKMIIPALVIVSVLLLKSYCRMINLWRVKLCITGENNVMLLRKKCALSVESSF